MKLYLVSLPLFLNWYGYFYGYLWFLGIFRIPGTSRLFRGCSEGHHLYGVVANHIIIFKIRFSFIGPSLLSGWLAPLSRWTVPCRLLYITPTRTVFILILRTGVVLLHCTVRIGRNKTLRTERHSNTRTSRHRNIRTNRHRNIGTEKNRNTRTFRNLSHLNRLHLAHLFRIQVTFWRIHRGLMGIAPLPQPAR